MPPRFRDANKLPARTDSYWVRPKPQHGERPEVPTLTDENDEHFKPKWRRNPSTLSPLSIVAIAVLSQSGKEQALVGNRSVQGNSDAWFSFWMCFIYQQNQKGG